MAQKSRNESGSITAVEHRNQDMNQGALPLWSQGEPSCMTNDDDIMWQQTSYSWVLLWSTISTSDIHQMKPTQRIQNVFNLKIETNENATGLGNEVNPMYTCASNYHHNPNPKKSTKFTPVHRTFTTTLTLGSQPNVHPRVKLSPQP